MNVDLISLGLESNDYESVIEELGSIMCKRICKRNIHKCCPGKRKDITNRSRYWRNVCCYSTYRFKACK